MGKTGKRWIAGILLILLLSVLAGCGAQERAVQAFCDRMENLSSGEKMQVERYFDLSDELEDFRGSNKQELENAILTALKKIEYEVTSSEKLEGNHVKIEATITTLDAKETIGQFVNRVEALVMQQEYRNNMGNMKKEEYQKLLAEQMIAVLTQEDIPTSQTPVTVIMEKETFGWELQNEEAFMNDILGNLLNALDSLV